MKIRKIKKLDLKTRVSWMNNPKVYQSMHFQTPVMLKKTIQWYRKNETDNSRVDVSFVDSEDRLVAMGGLTHIDLEVKKAELYIFVSPDIHGKGYGTYCTALLCYYGFSILGLHKVYFYTNARNLPAKHIYEKVGFMLEGCLREELIEDNSYGDRLYYGLLKHEFNIDKLREGKAFRNDVQDVCIIITDSTVQ